MRYGSRIDPAAAQGHTSAPRSLRSIAHLCDRLEEAEAVPEETRGPLWMDGVKYLLVVLITECVTVARHVIESSIDLSQRSDAHAVHELGSEGIVSADLAMAVGQAVDLRNLLLDPAEPVGPAQVMPWFDDIGTFRAFVSEISVHLAETDDSDG